MNNDKIRILLVDDSSLMRLLVSDMLNQEPDFEVIGTASNGKEALRATIELNPSVVVLDLIMKDYDGLYAVNEIMAKAPCPIIILSSVGNVQPQSVFEALEAGAYDFVNKPEGAFGGKVREVAQDLAQRIRQAAKTPAEQLRPSPMQINNAPHTFDAPLAYQTLLIGGSTGASSAIESMLKKMPNNFPLPIIIAQHIPESFGHSFGQRLNENTPFRCKVAQDREIIVGNTVYLAPSTHNIQLKKLLEKVQIRFTAKRFDAYNFPSVDALFLSAAEVYAEQNIAVLLSGMGKDGAIGMQALKQKGSFTIAQDEASSVVFGMPRAAIELGAVHSVLPLKEIPNFVVSCLS